MGEFVNFIAGASMEVLPVLAPHAILYNVAHNASSPAEIRATLEMFKHCQPKYVMQDGGGYQLLQKKTEGVIITHDQSRPVAFNKDGGNLGPIHGIQAAVALQPDIIISLDLPIDKKSDPAVQYEELISSLGSNLVWMRETAQLRQKYCPEIELFIPIQTYTLDQFETYVEKPLLELKYDGVSLPTRNLGPGGVSLFLLKFYQMGIRKVHILSESSFTGMALAAYFARHFFSWLSIDATSWRKQAEKQTYMDPFDFHGILVNSDAVFKEGERPVCDCPWCAGGITFAGITNIPLTDRSSFLRCHNYYVIQKAGKEFYENSGDLVTLERCLRRRSTRKKKKIDKLIQALSIATHMRDADIKVLEEMLWKI